MTSSTEWNPCFIIPTYNNPVTIRSVVERARTYGYPVIVVDDGSSAPGRRACDELERAQLALVIRHPHNMGKGAAVKTGFRAALEGGFTHGLQVDGDAQHDLSHVPPFMQASQEQPAALILGYPVYDSSAPRIRLVARKITAFWVSLEVGFGRIRDAMIGFRVYPLAVSADLCVNSNRMDFDIEIVVRAAWAKIPIINLPVKLRYLDASEGGVSHFKVWRDNLSFFRLHSKLCTLRCMSWLLPRPRRLNPGSNR